MWEQITKYSAHGISAISYKSKNDKIPKKYAIGIFFGTYESRGLVSSSLLDKEACNISVLVFFEEAADHELRKQFDPILEKQVSYCSRHLEKIENVSIRNVEVNIDKIFEKIPPEAYADNNEWFVDSVGAPKPYYLGIIAKLHQRTFAPKVSLFCPTGDYEQDNHPEIAYSFTDGFDKYMWVPYLWGKPDPALQWCYIFLLGFEGDRSYDIYDRFEPKYIKAVVGKPGYKEGYENVALERNARFLKEITPQIIYADAADAINAWQIIQSLVAEYETNSNICIVPLGSKPHAIAGGLIALSSDSPSLLYVMPRSFRVRDIKRGEYIWLYEINL